MGSLAGGTFTVIASGDSSARRLERRWAQRYSYRTEIEIEWGSAILRARTRDISSNGMFIESTDTLWVGAGFTARLSTEPFIKVNCTVRRVEPGQGMGVTLTPSEAQNEKPFHDLLACLSRART